MNTTPQPDNPEDIELTVAERHMSSIAFSRQELIGHLARWIQEQIKSCPDKGQGVHPWLFKTALLLHRYFSEDQIEDILSQYVSCDEREREIREAVAN